MILDIKYKNKYKIFDMHTHAYPDNIADKARINLGKFYDLHINHSPTMQALTDMQKNSGSSGFCLFSVATSPEQVIKINNWLYESKINYSSENFKIECFASMHQDVDDKDKLTEVERVIKLGFKGIKIHPDIQQVDADSEKLFALYEAIEGRISLYLHAGDARYNFSLPEKIIKIKKRYPNLKIIAAHLGGYQKWDSFEEMYGGKNIYIDTSSALWAMDLERAREIILNYDTDKIFFATDYPVMSIEEELALLQKLELNDDVLEKILFKNAANFFEI